MSTVASDFAFEPKVWSDHIKAYFDRLLVFGAFAMRNNDLEGEGTGLSVNFPYYKTLGEAQEPAENESLIVDKLQDDSFSATVFEVAKAVGFKKKVFKKSAQSQDKVLNEATRQLGRVHAEKLDAKLLTEMETSYTSGFLATLAADTFNVRNLNIARVKAFGDKNSQAIVCFAHSLQLLDFMNDTTAGFLKADALDPYNMVSGFKGRMFGMAMIETDNVTKVADINGKSAYRAIICKENAYGIMTKQMMELDQDKDILNREIIVTSNEWYAVKNFDRKISSSDKKIASCTTTVTN